MEFRFNLNDIFNDNVVEVDAALIPPGFKGDKRSLWDTQSKIAQIVNAMGEASARAQGLTKPITTSDRLRNSEHKLYFLVDNDSNDGKGAVTGMLKIGEKSLYVFDREGQHYKVSPCCVLDFYVHESRQRAGLGRKLFEYMLQQKNYEPEKLAIDRPSDKFLRFLEKHYGLDMPIKQMNNFVVYDGFFPKTQEDADRQHHRSSDGDSEPIQAAGKRSSANGLQSYQGSPYGRHAAYKPTCSMGQIIHNDTAVVRNSESAGIRSHSSREQPDFFTSLQDSQSQPENPQTIPNVPVPYQNQTQPQSVSPSMHVSQNQDYPQHQQIQNMIQNDTNICSQYPQTQPKYISQNQDYPQHQQAQNMIQNDTNIGSQYPQSQPIQQQAQQVFQNQLNHDQNPTQMNYQDDAMIQKYEQNKPNQELQGYAYNVQDQQYQAPQFQGQYLQNQGDFHQTPSIVGQDYNGQPQAYQSYAAQAQGDYHHNNLQTGKEPLLPQLVPQTQQNQRYVAQNQPHSTQGVPQTQQKSYIAQNQLNSNQSIPQTQQNQGYIAQNQPHSVQSVPNQNYSSLNVAQTSQSMPNQTHYQPQSNQVHQNQSPNVSQGQKVYATNSGTPQSTYQNIQNQPNYQDYQLQSQSQVHDISNYQNVQGQLSQQEVQAQEQQSFVHQNQLQNAPIHPQTSRVHVQNPPNVPSQPSPQTQAIQPKLYNQPILQQQEFQNPGIPRQTEVQLQSPISYQPIPQSQEAPSQHQRTSLQTPVHPQNTNYQNQHYQTQNEPLQPQASVAQFQKQPNAYYQPMPQNQERQSTVVLPQQTQNQHHQPQNHNNVVSQQDFVQRNPILQNDVIPQQNYMVQSTAVPQQHLEPLQPQQGFAPAGKEPSNAGKQANNAGDAPEMYHSLNGMQSIDNIPKTQEPSKSVPNVPFSNNGPELNDLRCASVFPINSAGAVVQNHNQTQNNQGGGQKSILSMPTGRQRVSRVTAGLDINQKSKNATRILKMNEMQASSNKTRSSNVKEFDISKGYPPHMRQEGGETENENSTNHKAERPQSLEIQPIDDRNGADNDDFNSEYPSNQTNDENDGHDDEILKIEKDFEKASVSPRGSTPGSVAKSPNYADAAGMASSGRNTPPGLTEKGYYDLKFYHNKLW